MKLENQLRRAIQREGHAINTERSYVQYYNTFLRFVKTKYGQYRHPCELDKQDVADFLTHLAADKNLAPDTQRVALSALKFLYKQVLEQDIGLVDFTMSTKPKKLPVVMSFEETAAMLEQFHGLKRLQSDIMYGCGLRISDCLRLRVKDLDFPGSTIQVNDSKGCKNRLLMMPRTIKRTLKNHLDRVREVFDTDPLHRMTNRKLPRLHRSRGLGRLDSKYAGQAFGNWHPARNIDKTL